MFITALVIDNNSVVVHLIQFGVLNGDGNKEWLFHVVDRLTRNNVLSGAMIRGVQSEQHRKEFGGSDRIRMVARH